MLASTMLALASVFVQPSGTSAAFGQVGPCYHPDCPQVDITVCHNPETGNSSAVLRDHSTGGVKYAVLGMGSTKTLHWGGVAFFPCPPLTWDDVDECSDIWVDCPDM